MKMSSIYSICLFLLVQVSFWSPAQMECNEDVEEKFIEIGIPEAIGLPAPRQLLQVEFPNNKEVCFGNELDVADVLVAPNVHWYLRPRFTGTYAVFYFDPDELDGVLQWSVINIKNGDVSSGTVFNNYNLIEPDAHHRKVFLLFEQQYDIKLDVAKKAKGELSAVKFNMQEFAEENDLTLVAGNFFLVSGPLKTVESKVEQINV